MAIKVTCEDTETGDTDTKIIPDNNYVLIVTGKCELTNTQVYPAKGTHVLTIKGVRS